jgi:UDP-glucose 4-epimerase
MAVVCVTGAGGYVGQLLVRALVADGHAVRALVRRTGVTWPSGVDEVVGDLVVDADAAGRAVEGADAVVHLAGPSELLVRSEPDRFLRDTVVCAERVGAAASAAAARLVYVSSVHVYGDALRSGAVITEDTPLEPSGVYAQSRQACEEIFTAQCDETVVLRQTNGIGAPASVGVHCWHLLTNELCRSGAVSGRLVLQSPGLQWRDFIPLVDAVAVHTAAACGDELVSGVWNVGSGRSITVRAMAELIAESFERVGAGRPVLDVPDVGGSGVPAGGEAYRIDVSRLAKTGLGSTTSLEDALDGIVRFCLDRVDELRP